jgi:hypothetical protein
MTHLLAESTMRLDEAARISGVHFSSVYRWVLRGVPGPDGERIRLEAIRLGRAWITSREALSRFSARLTRCLDEESGPLPRAAGKRRRASERAARELEQDGI